MYAGPVMNRCARIASFAPIGHILTTATVWQIAHQSCSTGRLYDASSADVSSSGGDGIWIINHGWYTFKGVRQPLEIVHIQDAELCKRPFPDVLPRLQRLSSHIADGLRRNEMQYAQGNRVVQMDQGHILQDSFFSGTTDSDLETRKLQNEVEVLRNENDILKYEIQSLKSKYTEGTHM